MGLLLSILVSCVGVVDLIAFYSDLRRVLRVPNSESNDLETITCDYRRMLTKEYRQIFAEVNGKEAKIEIKTNFALSTSPKAIFNSVDNHKESISNTNCTEVNLKSIPAQVDTKGTRETNDISNLETNKSVPVRIKTSDVESQVGELKCVHDTNHIPKLEATSSKPVDNINISSINPKVVDTLNATHETHYITKLEPTKSLPIQTEVSSSRSQTEANHIVTLEPTTSIPVQIDTSDITTQEAIKSIPIKIEASIVETQGGILNTMATVKHISNLETDTSKPFQTEATTVGSQAVIRTCMQETNHIATLKTVESVPIQIDTIDFQDNLHSASAKSTLLQVQTCKIEHQISDVSIQESTSLKLTPTQMELCNCAESAMAGSEFRKNTSMSLDESMTEPLLEDRSNHILTNENSETKLTSIEVDESSLLDAIHHTPADCINIEDSDSIENIYLLGDPEAHLIYDDIPNHILIHEMMPEIGIDEMPQMVETIYFIQEPISDLEMPETEMDELFQNHEGIYLLEETITDPRIFGTFDDTVPENVAGLYLLDEPMIDPVYGNRCPSPFPTYELLAAKDSISSELLECPKLSLIEVEEDENGNEVDEDEISKEIELGNPEMSTRRSRSRSRSPAKHRSLSPDRSSKTNGRALSPFTLIDLQIGRQRRNRSESPNKRSIEDDFTPHLQKRRRSKSSSDLCGIIVCRPPTNYQLVVGDFWRRSPSPFEELVAENTCDTTQQYVLVEEEIFSDDFKNSLDGVKAKYPNEDRKREFKRRRNNRNRLSQNSLDEQSTSNSRDNFEILALEEASQEINLPGTENILIPSNMTNSSSSAIGISEDSLTKGAANAVSDQLTKSINTALNESENKETVVETPKPGPSTEVKKQEKSEPFWVN